MTNEEFSFDNKNEDELSLGEKVSAVFSMATLALSGAGANPVSQYEIQPPLAPTTSIYSEQQTREYDDLPGIARVSSLEDQLQESRELGKGEKEDEAERDLSTETSAGGSPPEPPENELSLGEEIELALSETASSTAESEGVFESENELSLSEEIEMALAETVSSTAESEGVSESEGEGGEGSEGE
jgi:hypothetical protein